MLINITMLNKNYAMFCLYRKYTAMRAIVVYRYDYIYFSGY